MTIFANIGFMGYPLLDAMYGGEAVIHAAIFNLLYSFSRHFTNTSATVFCFFSCSLIGFTS
jgi:predicted permease